jgi:hypothetical protein
MTATDAGSSATVNIASFTYVSNGKSVSVNGGSITGQAYQALLYIYFSDPSLSGGTVTFLAATSKSTVLSSSGNIYVGSITTPLAGAPNTIGNADGGVGAQSGQTTVLGIGATVTSSTQGNGSISNATDVLGDGTSTVFAQMTVTAQTGQTNLALITVTGFPAVAVNQFSQLFIAVDAQCTDTLSPSGSSLDSVSLVTSNSLTHYGTATVISRTQGSGTFSRQILAAALPTNINLSQMTLDIQILANTHPATSPDATSGSVVLKIWRVYVYGVS